MNFHLIFPTGNRNFFCTLSTLSSPFSHFLFPFFYCRVLCLFTILCRKFAGNGINYSQYSKFSVCLGEGQLTCFPALGIIREATLARRECERNLRQLCNWQERVRLDVAGDRHTLTHTHTQPSKNNIEIPSIFCQSIELWIPPEWYPPSRSSRVV